MKLTEYLLEPRRGIRTGDNIHEVISAVQITEIFGQLGLNF